MTDKVEEVGKQAKADHDRLGIAESSIDTLTSTCGTMKSSITDLELTVEGDNNGRLGLVRKWDLLDTRMKFVLKVFSIGGSILLAVVTFLAIQLGIFLLKMAPVILQIANAP
jgi:hypothetical protein